VALFAWSIETINEWTSQPHGPLLEAYQIHLYLCLYVWQVPAHVDAVKRVLKVDNAATAEPLLQQLEQGPKLLALRDIFVQCGLLGDPAGNGGSSSVCGGALPPRTGSVVKQEGGEVLSDGGDSSGGHRLLVFAQLKGTLDLVESQLLQPLGLTYLRLDGSVSAGARFGLVQQFNSDPTIQVRAAAAGGWRGGGGCCSCCGVAGVPP
jgi:TATA-binding protein-associated factor